MVGEGALMSGVVSIGDVPWSRGDMLARLEQFASLYDRRPITDNTDGMLSPHMFLAWVALQALQPKAIVESGVFLGQGTWFFEQACPEARLYCIDLDLSRIRYRSDRAEYFDRDFSTIDWSPLPRDATVLFFDDHQDAYERVKIAKWFGFKHLIFEDNFPPSQGDCYSLKRVFMHSGFKFAPPPYWSLRARLKWQVAKRFGILADRYAGVPPNELDERYLRENLDVYYEFPPVFRSERTMWGDPWDNVHYPTPDALLTSVEKDYQRRFMEEAMYYGWMCYARLK
jgi:hypothetical protein